MDIDESGNNFISHVTTALDVVYAIRSDNRSGLFYSCQGPHRACITRNCIHLLKHSNG